MRKLSTGLVLLLLLFTFMVGCDREVTETIIVNNTDESNCFSCHNDQAFGLDFAAIQEEYTYSIHGSGNNTNRNSGSCAPCHTSQGFVEAASGIPASGDHYSAIDCFTCHAPHTAGTFGLRVTEAIELEDGTSFDRGLANLCVSCHHSRRDVNEYVYDGVSLSGHWGPHRSNQGDMLIGANAYEYDNYSYTKSWHADGTTEGCIDCHMSAPAHSSIGGHSWNMRNEDRGIENLTGCNAVGCHSTDPIDDLDRDAHGDFDWDGTIEGVQTEIHGLLDSLLIHLVAAGFTDSTGHPLSGVTVNTADSAGALYNFLFVEEDRSIGVHNTDYTVALLQSSINFLNSGDPNGAPGSGKIVTAYK